MFNEKQTEKLSLLRESGISPYPEPRNVTRFNYENLKEFSLSLLSQQNGVICGRLRFKNEMGGLGFGRIENQDGRVQLLIRRNNVSVNSFTAWKKLDLGDWVYVTGSFSRTRTGELTFIASELSLAAKCINPMPDKLAGLTDIEIAYRKRYLDLATNRNSRGVFILRSKVSSAIRNFLDRKGFLEVETPMLHSIPGGALAKPFETRHNALGQNMYLRIAPELYLKRLLVGGFEKVYELNRCFRNEGIGTKYNPEFTTVELYQAHANYQDLINLISSILTMLTKYVVGSEDLRIPYQDGVIDFGTITQIRFDSMIASLGVDNPWDIDDLRRFWAINRGEREGLPVTISGWYDLIFDEFIQSTLINPTFITHHPAEMSPLARKTEGDPLTVDRFELYIGGMEISDGWTELNDPVEQADNFLAQVKERANGNDEAMYFDEEFIDALSYGMPPSAGVGLGIDRLMMILANKKSIRDVILFPTLRNK